MESPWLRRVDENNYSVKAPQRQEQREPFPRRLDELQLSDRRVCHPGGYVRCLEASNP